MFKINKGLSNFQIDDYFKNEENEDLKKKYPFAIFGTDKENEPGVHWWSFMDIHPKNNLFLFDSFGIEGFKLFIVDNDQDIINELLYDFKKCESKSSQKLKLCTMKFCVKTWQKCLKKQKTN